MPSYRMIVMVLAFTIATLLSGCVSPELKTAKRELNKATESLPQFQNSEHIKTLMSAWSDAKDGYPPCYYAREWIVMGSQLPIEHVIESTTPSLQQQGWVIEDWENGSSRVFKRGDQERLVIEGLVWGGEVAWAAENEINQTDFQHLFTIRIDYMLPSRDQC